MGCAASAPFPEDGARFLGGAAFPAAPRYLDASLVSRAGPLSFCLRRGLARGPGEYAVRRGDGSALCAVESGAKALRVRGGGEALAAVLAHSVRHSEVNGIDAAFNLPHVYVYAPQPYAGDPGEADFTDGDTPLYLWARVHSTSMSSKCSTYEVALAEGRRGGTGLNIETFGGSSFASKDFGGGRVAIKWNGKGAARATNAEFDFECENCYGVATAPNVDPILMMCCLFAMETLGNR